MAVVEMREAVADAVWSLVKKQDDDESKRKAMDALTEIVMQPGPVRDAPNEARTEAS